MVMPRWCHLCSECMNSESFGGEGGGLAFHYSIHAFPLAIHTWGALSSQASSTKEMKIAPVSPPLSISLSLCFSSNCSDSAYSRSSCKSAIIPRECSEHKNPNFHSFFFFLFQEGIMQSREGNQNCRTTTRGVCLRRPSWSSFQNMCTKRERKRKSANQNPGTKEESSWTYREREGVATETIEIYPQSPCLHLKKWEISYASGARTTAKAMNRIVTSNWCWWWWWETKEQEQNRTAGFGR